VSAGDWDAYLAKYDTNGNLNWTRQLGTSNREDSRAVFADGTGNVIVAGSYGIAPPGDAGNSKTLLARHRYTIEKVPIDDVNFDVGIHAGGDLHAIHLSDGSLQLIRLTLDFATGENDTFFDTLAEAPGTIAEGFSVTSNESNVTLSLPDDTLTHAQQIATFSFDDFDPQEIIGIGFDTDTFSNPDHNGEPLEAVITATFSNGETLVKTISEFPFTLEDESFSFSTAAPPNEADGDYNADGITSGADFLAWQRGESPDPLSAEDLSIWQQAYGQIAAAKHNFSVPEPLTAGLLGSLLPLFCRRKHV
jgi:hypothetical protein